ncbi:hypothetical protein KUCAC02_034183 [Chaenocephalus aceratus]|nr:hypothetical protein KUCAC02_034183 [Chaenocephalus aceratus]
MSQGESDFKSDESDYEIEKDFSDGDKYGDTESNVWDMVCLHNGLMTFEHIYRNNARMDREAMFGEDSPTRFNFDTLGSQIAQIRADNERMGSEITLIREQINRGNPQEVKRGDKAQAYKFSNRRARKIEIKSVVESEANGSGASETGDPESKEIQSSECCDPQMTRIETGLNAAFSSEKTRETQRDFNGIMFGQYGSYVSLFNKQHHRKDVVHLQNVAILD